MFKSYWHSNILNFLLHCFLGLALTVLLFLTALPVKAEPWDYCNLTDAGPKGWSFSFEQLSIIRCVKGKSAGVLTKDMHRTFWLSFVGRAKDDPRERTATLTRAKSELNLLIAYDRAQWQSAALTLKAGKVQFVPQWPELKEKIKSVSFTSDLGTEIVAPHDSPEFMLEMIAKGAPIWIGRKLTKVTPLLIDRMLYRIKARETRLGFLFDENWDGKPRRYSYPEAGFVVDWPTPFAPIVEKSIRILEDPQKGLAFIGTFHGHDGIIISVRDMPEGWPDINAGLKAHVKGNLSNIDEKLYRMRTEPWRGYSSLIVELSMKNTKKSGHLRMRYFVNAQQNRLFRFLSASVKSQEAARSDMERFEKNFHLLNAEGK